MSGVPGAFSEPQAPDHGEWLEFAVGFAFDALEPAEEQRFRDHLGECEQCRRMVAETSAAMSDMAFALPPEPPPPSLRADVLDAVADTSLPPLEGEAGPEPAPLVRPQPRRWWRSTTATRLTVAASVTLLAVIAAGVWTLVSRTSQRSIAEQCAAVACPTAQLTSSGRNVARVMVLDGTVYVEPVTLPPNQPQRNEYVLWRLGADRHPVAVGGFDVARGSTGATRVGPLVVPARDVQAVALSEERGRTPPAAPSRPIARGELG